MTIMLRGRVRGIWQYPPVSDLVSNAYDLNLLTEHLMKFLILLSVHNVGKRNTTEIN